MYLCILLHISFMNNYHVKETRFAIKNYDKILKILLYDTVFTINHHYSVI